MSGTQMNGQRFSVIGLAKVRAPWFSQLAHWSTSSMIAVDFMKCISASEVSARLTSSTHVSAVILDATAVGVDAALISAARSNGAAVIIVADPPPVRDWLAMGAVAILSPSFTRNELLDALIAHCSSPNEIEPAWDAPDVVDVPLDVEVPARRSPHWRGTLIAVTGAGGCGTSTLAMAIAQGMASNAGNERSVALADLSIRADLAMYHDVRDVVPGIQELVEAHRRGNVSRREVRDHFFDIEERGYQLLLGIRRVRDWTELRPPALEAAFDALLSNFRVVVCDIDNEFDGEAETNSNDIEDRNAPARLSAWGADVVVVVGDSTLKGLHGIIRTERDLIRIGVEEQRILTVINRAPRSPRARAELASALVDLGGANTPIGPMFVSERRQIEIIHGTAGPLPSSLVNPVTNSVALMINNLGSSNGVARGRHSARTLVPIGRRAS